MKNILMVCVGNICRSPMAEGVLRSFFQNNALDVLVSSAGIHALVGKSADANAIALMEQKGLDIRSHKATQLTAELLLEADLVLVMEAWQQREIGCLYPSAYGKVHRVGKWGDFDILDPYRESTSHFIEAYNLIERGLQDWQKRLWK